MPMSENLKAVNIKLHYIEVLKLKVKTHRIVFLQCLSVKILIINF